VEGQRSGKGKYCYLNGDVYEGDWRADKKEGFGNLKMSTGDNYEGEW
jgi:hypothetical protein